MTSEICDRKIVGFQLKIWGSNIVISIGQLGRYREEISILVCIGLILISVVLAVFLSMIFRRLTKHETTLKAWPLWALSKASRHL